MPEVITSIQNPRVKNLVRLREGSHRRRQKRFLIEGYREIARAHQCGWPLETVYFCEDLFKQDESFELLHALEASGIELVQMTPDPFAKGSYRQGPDGLLAIAIQRQWDLDELPLSGNPLLVILEGIEKPGNLGAIFRTANAAGADAIIITDPVTDPFNPNTIRASQGAFFHLPFCCTDNAGAFVFLEEKAITPVLTSPSANKTLWEADLRKPSAIVLGAEDTGLTREWMENFPTYRIPMHGVTDSLNVASMAAVALFEAVRQRH
ncbi:MAG TPA: RNA methyltransferase [Oceanipulchritudo sp.]|nr:RNA methyltransferase [Oceanipulchritudo sp.]